MSQIINAAMGVAAGGATGALAGLTVGARLASQRARAQLARLRDRAERDALTGVFNRRGLTGAYRRLYSQHGTDQAVIVADLDAFKPINDTHGHAAGDAVLIEVANRLAGHAADWSGVAARLGGDEFAVLLPASTLGERATPTKPADLASWLFQAITTRPVDLPGWSAPVWVRASVGIATVATAGGLWVALGAADRAMYRAKTAGPVAEASPDDYEAARRDAAGQHRPTTRRRDTAHARRLATVPTPARSAATTFPTPMTRAARRPADATPGGAA